MPQNLNAPVVALLQLSKCLMCASADTAAHSFPNIFDFSFPIYFSVPVMDCEKGCPFFSMQVNCTKTCLIWEIRSVFLALSPFPTVAT